MVSLCTETDTERERQKEENPNNGFPGKKTKTTNFKRRDMSTEII